MTFLHPVFLLTILLPLAYGFYRWNRASRKTALALKVLSFCAIGIALAEPVATMPETKTGVVVLVDTSASISDDDLAREQSLVAAMSRAAGSNFLRIIPFTSQARELKPEEAQQNWRFERTANEQQGTNLEAAIREGISAIPAGRIPRLVLISDGKENEGSSARAIAQVERLGIPVDAFTLGGRQEGGLQLLSVSVPRQGYAAEQIPIDLAVKSARASSAVVSLRAEGKLIGQNQVELQPGINQVHVRSRINAAGATTISGQITEAGGGSVQFEQALTLKRAQVLYLSQDSPSADANLLKALAEAQFDVKTSIDESAKSLNGTQLVVLNNLDLQTLSPSLKQRLEEHVKDGGGLLLIGGEKQVYKDRKQQDALDRALPADLAPPRTPEGTCVALIIDKSSSMEGRKIDLARLSAVGVVDHLRPIDLIGVLIFDNSYQWAVPIRRSEDKSLIKRLISGITPDGGTQIAPALAEAYRRVLAAPAAYKHIVLLTDGISEEGDSLELSKEALAHQVTISTVGLGQDVNRSYLDRVANLSGGQSYFLNEPQGLEQILLKDVLQYTGSTAVEKPLKALVDRKAEVLEGTAIETAPALRGYARFAAKPTAETVLSINQEKKDPLYVRWQYGLGRAAVFSSDAKSRWASDWLNWPGFDRFWINVTRDLLPHSNAVEAVAHFDSANNDLVVDYHLGREAEKGVTIPAIYVLGPRGFRKPINVAEAAAGSYHGRLHIGEQRGLFRIRPLTDSPLFPEVGFYREQEETLDYGSNPALLQQIANLSGGQLNPAPPDVFRSGGRYLPVIWRLWPAFLGLAIVLTVAELILRKWRNIVQRFSSRWATVSK